MDQPIDYGIPAKQWKKIKGYTEKLVPKFRKEAKAQQKKMKDYKDSSPMNTLIFEDIFKYVPSEAVVVILVLKAALQD